MKHNSVLITGGACRAGLLRCVAGDTALQRTGAFSESTDAANSSASHDTSRKDGTHRRGGFNYVSASNVEWLTLGELGVRSVPYISEYHIFEYGEVHEYLQRVGFWPIEMRFLSRDGIHRPRQTGRYGMVLPNLLEQAIAGRPMTVFGDGTQARCFCSVHDIVDALIRFFACPSASGMVINPGAQEEVSNMDLARRIKSLTGSSSEIVLVPYDQAYGPSFDDMKRRVPDITRAFELLHWRPSRTLDEIILEMAPLLADTANEWRKLAAEGVVRSPMLCTVQRGC